MLFGALLLGRKIVTITLLLAAVLLVGRISFAEDATVLPRGVFRGSLDGRFYWPVDKRYGAKGDLEDLAVDYNNRTLDSLAFPSLSLVEKAFGMPPTGTAAGARKGQPAEP